MKKKRKISVTLDCELVESFRRLARRHGHRSLSSCINSALKFVRLTTDQMPGCMQVEASNHDYISEMFGSMDGDAAKSYGNVPVRHKQYSVYGKE